MTRLLARIKQWFQDRRIQAVTYDVARERVQRGAAYLDDVDPGWHERVDPSTLELADGSACILGQLHGDFRLGLGRSHLINLSSAPRGSLSPVAYGFKCTSDVPDEVQDRDYRMLNRAWREAIRERRPDAEFDAESGAEPQATPEAPAADVRESVPESATPIPDAPQPSGDGARLPHVDAITIECREEAAGAEETAFEG